MSYLLRFLMWVIAAQDQGFIGHAGYQFIWMTHIISLDVSLVLYYTGVCNMVFAGDDVAGWRYCVNITFWAFVSARAVLVVPFEFIRSLAIANPDFISTAKALQVGVNVAKGFTQPCVEFIFMVIAHRKMHVVSLHLSLPRSHGVCVHQFTHTHTHHVPYTMHHTPTRMHHAPPYTIHHTQN